MKKVTLIILFTMGLGLCASPAFAWSQFIIHLAKHGCYGKSNTSKNGCYAYIESRVNQAAKPDKALKWCKENRCQNWYRNDANQKKICIEGCTYLYKMGN